MNKELKPLSSFPKYLQQKLCKFLKQHNPDDLNIFAKISQQVIEFSDDNDIKLWDTTITIFSYVIMDKNNNIIDKYSTFAGPFFIRNQLEIDSVNELLNTIQYELDNFKVPKNGSSNSENSEQEDTIIYDA